MRNVEKERKAVNEKQNRPRVEWKNGKCVVIDPAKSMTRQSPKTARESVIHSKEQKSGMQTKREQPSQTKTGFLDFLLEMRFRRSVLVAILIIGVLSITVAAVLPAVFSDDGEDVRKELTDSTLVSDEVEVKIVAPKPSDEPLVSENIAICIDPGHGFDDVGTSNIDLGIYEHDVNLAVGLALREKLEDAGIRIYMTHDTNEPPTDASRPYLFGMKKRNGLANSLSDVRLFISLHCDAYFEDTSVYGPRVYHMENDKGGTEVAYAISESLGELYSDKSIYVNSMKGYDSYQVLRESDVPAVLLEMGFLSNPEEGTRMLSDEWVEEMSDAIARAICEAFEDGVIGE